MTKPILVVDNYDSFVYTLVGYLRQLGGITQVVRNDQVFNEHLSSEYLSSEIASHFAGVLVSPGPGTPQGAGQSLDVIRACALSAVPMFGVCLGHQALGEAFGASVVHAPELLHGKTSCVDHDGTGLFAGLPSPLTVGRYHSLVVDPATVPPELRVTAHSDGIIMGLAHRTLPLHSVQFHPESILTDGGMQMVANWLEMAS